jgi:hypothetical protein
MAVAPTPPSAQSKPPPDPPMPPGAAAQVTLPLPWAVHSSPEQDDEPLAVAMMCTESTAFRADTQLSTLLAPT